jgi:hypothetical protein
VAAERGRLVQLELTSSLFDPQLEVISPSGREFASSGTPTEGGSVLEFEAPESGIYRVRASSAYGGGLGTYRISYQESEPRRVIAEFEGFIGESEGGVSVGEHELDAQAGETAVIEAQSNDFDTMLMVEAPDGSIEAENDDYGDGWNSRVDIRFQQTGTYTLIVEPYWNGEGGSYQITVSR